jgi:arginine decarboxylase
MDGVRLDPTKITIDTSGTGHPAESIKAALLDDHGIQVEKCTANTLTVLFTIGTTRAKAARLLWALRAVAASAKARPGPAPAVSRAPRVPDIGAFHCLPRDAHFQRGEVLPLFDADGALDLGLVGKVAAEMVVPKPPGIPVLVPGR